MKAARFRRVYNRRALLVTFLAGVLAGVGLGLMARALRVPGFVRRLPWVVSASDVPLPSRPGVGTTAMPMGAPSVRRLVTLWDSLLRQPPMKLRGKETRSEGRTRRIARAIVRSHAGVETLNLANPHAARPMSQTGDVPDGEVSWSNPNSTARSGSPFLPDFSWEAC